MLKDFKIAVLLDRYGELLTEKQRSFLDYYYNQDLSLSEIAENEGITRQAVRDAVKHAQQQLTDLENKLHFCEQIEAFESVFGIIEQTAAQLPDSEQKRCILALAHLQKEE